MTISRLVSVRTTELERFSNAYRQAVKRLITFLDDHPEANELDRNRYVDGSERRVVGERWDSPFSPARRVWKVGCISNRIIYIYQDVDMDAWLSNSNRDDDPVIDLDIYHFAITMPEKVAHYCENAYIGTVESSDFAKIDWSLDDIIEITDMLEVFGRDKDMSARRAEFSARYGRFHKALA